MYFKSPNYITLYMLASNFVQSIILRFITFENLKLEFVLVDNKHWFVTAINYFICLLSIPFRDVDGAVVRPIPKAKRMLSDASCLPHIVQLLLTFDPVIVEKVAILLTDVMVVRTTLVCLHTRKINDMYSLEV